MQTIEKITRTKASLVQRGLLNPANWIVLRKHFRDQLHNYEVAGTVALGLENRVFLALERGNISFVSME